jgi:hypothetical protein
MPTTGDLCAAEKSIWKREDMLVSGELKLAAAR